jgi:hypothetical protein
LKPSHWEYGQNKRDHHKKEKHAKCIEETSHTSHVLFSQDTFLGGPLEASNDGILDFVQVLDSLGDVNDDIWACAVWTEAPDLTGFCDIL